ncbi:DNA topoisomerase [Handroanthus impetiginosus]|uniref:DNA topoisomerase n=1 Tax=Handroanthus impetiginosus TaxID=429701 RepID=A0A2G9H9V5_9LAMI|nr:DNA topoisomerase [Handroanthus impetiginosus]
MSELGGINCFGGNLARVRTSWTKENPGRRFLSCANRDGGCRFFEWEDSPLYARSRVIIPGLFRRLNALEKENARLARKMKYIKAVLCWKEPVFSFDKVELAPLFYILLRKKRLVLYFWFGACRCRNAVVHVAPYFEL